MEEKTFLMYRITVRDKERRFEKVVMQSWSKFENIKSKFKQKTLTTLFWIIDFDEDHTYMYFPNNHVMNFSSYIFRNEFEFLTFGMNI